LDKQTTYAIVALDHQRRADSLQGEDESGLDQHVLGTDPALGLVLHYHIPENLDGKVEPGQLAVVPLRGRPSYGVIVGLAESAPVGPTLPISKLLDPRPVLSPAMLSLAEWMAGHYRCTLWQAISPMLPPGVARRAITLVGLAPSTKTGSDSSPLVSALGRRQTQVVSLLKSAPKATLTLSKLKRDYSGAASGLPGVMRDLERKGLLTRTTQLPGPRSRPQQERIIRLSISSQQANEAIDEASHRAPLQAAALSWLLKRSGSLTTDDRRQATDEDITQPEIRNTQCAIRNREWLPLRDLYFHTGATSATVTSLERKGLVELSQRAVERNPVPPTASSPKDEPPNLTPAQAAAWHEIAAALQVSASTMDLEESKVQSPKSNVPPTQDSKFKIQNFLLHGVTGSGKTEIYLRAIGMALRMGKQAIALVPEISLTPQAVHRFASRFPGRVALIHSQLSPGQQFDEWRRIREGHADIVVGSRSAIFAPLPNLGLIVVDEEHEWAYKQDNAPRYHARDVALKRAELTGAVVVLGSATPDLATYHRAKTGEYKLLSLPTRVGRRRTRGGAELTTELPMPQMQVVDMRAELRSGNTSLFSRSLQKALETTLASKEQAILYLNRRGSNSFILCHECGYVPVCRRCDVPLVYHADVYGMLCHRCNAFSLLPHTCARCHSPQVKGFGTGTQRVVDEVSALFPRARVLRWDRDTASRQGQHGGHSGLMEAFARGEADVLVGTQMIAKGLDIDRVTLVGVISADTGLYMPDFRAPERTVQLLMQVAGRAGRRAETTHSRAIVQTFNPEHYAIEAASRYDYKGFYKGEIRFRAEHGYPPYGQLARLVYASPSNERCEQQSGIVARYLRRTIEELLLADPTQDLDVLGPAPCFVHKVRGRYRWQVLLRGSNLSPLLEGFHPGVGWALDVDPMNLL
jgi:primosomal protein N' (replication factor Y)